MLEQELHTFFSGLGHLIRICRHVAFFPAVCDCHTCAQTDCSTGDVHGNVSATDHDDLLADGGTCAGVHFTQEVNSSPDTPQIIAGDAECGRLLGAGCEIDGFKALLTQLLDCHIFSDLDAAAEDHAELFEHVDLRVQNRLLQAERRDAVTEHAAGQIVLIKHGNAIVVRSEEVGTAEAGRSGADYRNLLVAEVI